MQWLLHFTLFVTKREKLRPTLPVIGTSYEAIYIEAGVLQGYLHRSWRSDVRYPHRETSRHRGHQRHLSHGRSQDNMDIRIFESVRASHVFSILNIWNIF